MPLYEFARKWIEDNVKDTLYLNMPDQVFELVNVILKQRHSGSSVRIVMRYFVELINAYLGDE